MIARLARLALGVGGLAMIGLGAWVLLFDAASRTPGQVAAWLAGAVVVHDLLLAPAVLLLGLAVRPLRRVRGALRGALLVGGCVTLVALPPLLRPGAPRNETVLPLDYGRNLALLLAVVAVGTGIVAGRSWWSGRRRDE
ncbi:hypothetical protein [Streptomyces sp. 6N223]|uniref:hypothetical protein n=1 Tax=Streptomyces sp. 6N223 TaxID=3457412 RepID=UPI003FD3E3FC